MEWNPKTIARLFRIGRRFSPTLAPTSAARPRLGRTEFGLGDLTPIHSTGYVLKTSWYGSAGSCQQVCDHVTIEPHSSWFAVVKCRSGAETSQAKLAREAGVGIGAVGDCEHELGRPSFGTLAAIREALERAGVEFTNGKKLGVRFGRSKSKGT